MNPGEPTPSDEELMTAYAAGDSQAFEILYERYRGKLFRFIRRTVWNEEACNDLYQGCWEKVITGRKKWRPGIPFAAWLFTVSRNHITDWFRSQGRRPDECFLSDPVEDTASDAPDQLLEQEDRDMALHEALKSLPGEQREAVILKLDAGLGLPDIARVTGVNSETAKSRLRYAVRKLNEALATEPGDPS